MKSVTQVAEMNYAVQ